MLSMIFQRPQPATPCVGSMGHVTVIVNVTALKTTLEMIAAPPQQVNALVFKIVNATQSYILTLSFICNIFEKNGLLF